VTNHTKPIAPLWVSLVVAAGVLVPPMIVVYVMWAHGWVPAAWAALAVGLANMGSRAARQYFGR
jgi:hypothetical protein